MNVALQLLLNGIINSAVYSLLAVGFGMAYRSTHFFQIAFGAVYVVASYCVLFFTHTMGLHLVPSIILGILTAMGTGIVMDKAVYLPLDKRGGSPGVLFVASLGLYIITVNLIALFFGNEVQILSSGIEPTYELASFVITRMQVVQFITGGIMVTLFCFIIRKNTFIKAIWAMGETPELVKALGLPYEWMRCVIFALSALFAAVASIVTTLDIGIDPHVGMTALLTGAVAVIVGGVESYRGWIGGATLLALLQSLAIWQFSARWNDLITFAMLILTLLIRPHGLFAPEKRKEEG